MRALALVFLLSTAPLFAEADIYTDGKLNGRAWINSDQNARAMCVAGISDGIASTNANPAVLFPITMNYGEIADSLDAFYSDSTNLVIPVVSAIYYTKHKAEGDSPQALRELEARLRKEAFVLKNKK